MANLNCFNKVLLDIVDEPLILKQTNNIFKENYKFFKIKRVENYYILNTKKFVWLKLWKNKIFIYGNPFPSYNF